MKGYNFILHISLIPIATRFVAIRLNSTVEKYISRNPAKDLGLKNIFRPAIGKGMEDVKVRVGRLIRQCRKEQGLTQKELAQKMGLSESTVTKYEKGKQNLSLETVQSIVDALELKLEIYFIK